MKNYRNPIDLYSAKILSLAANIPLSERLKRPHATVTKRSPLCGSMVTIDIEVSENNVSAFGQEVRACVLGQAAASILAQRIIGSSENQIRTIRGEVTNMLNGLEYILEPFDEFEVLSPAAEFTNRHASILLSLDATCEALDLARK
ncbi:MAG: iron-sulfur cluster assembly scaffold protein [Pseudomonadota bacterium]|nr:iron-sulfur cluster assembly scaffold protein [Pseudomonadota bacterium]